MNPPTVVIQPDWAGLVTALIAFLGAITAAVTLVVTLYNQSHIATMKSDLSQINGSLQKQMATKVNAMDNQAQMATKADAPGVPPYVAPLPPPPLPEPPNMPPPTGGP